MKMNLSEQMFKTHAGIQISSLEGIICEDQKLNNEHQKHSTKWFNNEKKYVDVFWKDSDKQVGSITYTNYFWSWREA